MWKNCYLSRKCCAGLKSRWYSAPFWCQQNHLYQTIFCQLAWHESCWFIIIILNNVIFIHGLLKYFIHVYVSVWSPIATRSTCWYNAFVPWQLCYKIGLKFSSRSFNKRKIFNLYRRRHAVPWSRCYHYTWQGPVSKGGPGGVREILYRDDPQLNINLLLYEQVVSLIFNVITRKYYL